MRFTNIILAVTATASLVVANPMDPMANPNVDFETTSPNIANESPCFRCQVFMIGCLQVNLSRNPKSLLVKMLTQ